MFSPNAPVIVCGLSPIGVRVIDQLVGSGVPVALVTRSLDVAVSAAAERWGIAYHPSGADVTAALRAAGIDQAQAVVCLGGNELWNLESALVASRLRSDLRVVLQLGNAAVAAAIRAGGDDGLTVLDVAELAAPSVVEACLGLREHRVNIGTAEFVVADLSVPHVGSLRSLFGDLAPVAIAHGAAADGSEVTLVPCPGRDVEVGPTDEVTMVGTPVELSNRHLLETATHPLAVVTQPTTRLTSRMAETVRAFLADANPNLFKLLLVLVGLLAVSTTILRFGYRKPGMSVLDALYFSSETIATVGYGDFNFSQQPQLLRVWSIMLMFAGVTTTAMIMAFLAELLISRRLSETVGKRAARGMFGHVIVIGLGEFGMRVATSLRDRGTGVVLVERESDDRLISTADQLQIPIVFGDATVAETLIDAGIERASAVAVLTSDDMTNIEIGIAARTLLGQRWHSSAAGRGVPVVLRLFDRALGDAVSARFDFRHTRSTAELAAPWFIGAALGLEVLATFSVQSASFMLGKLVIAPGGGLDGVELQEISASTRVVAISRSGGGDLEYPPRRGTRLHGGDIAYLVGPWEELLAALEHDRGRISS